MLTVGSLFAGIGGLDLGLERAGMQVRWQVEFDPYCNRVLEKHWPGVKRYGDIKQVNWSEVESVDVICGGFPCQPVSVAGSKKGDADERWLWPEFLRAIREVRPRYALVENVPGLLSTDDGRLARRVFGDLAEIGYDAEWGIVSAASVGAPHLRQRVFIVAYPEGDLRSTSWDERPESSDGRSSPLAEPNSDRQQGSVIHIRLGRPREAQAGPDGVGSDVSDSQSPERTGAGNAWRGGIRFADGDRDGISDWWAVEPGLGGTPDGFPMWLDRHIGRGLNYAESRRRTEVLRNLWRPYVSEALWRSVGGLDRIQTATALFTFVRQYENGLNEARLLVEGKEVSEAYLRSLWNIGKSSGAPHRSTDGTELPREHSDALQEMSRFLALNCEPDWSLSGWEDGIPRVANGVPNRVDRLKCLGNAVVPQVAEVVGRFILEIEKQKGDGRTDG